MNPEITETKNIIIWIENGILYGIYKKNSIIDLKAAEEIVRLRLSFSKGKNYPALIDGRNIGNITKQAREYLADEGCEGLEKAALLIGSNWSKILANIFLRINKPKVLMRAFTDKKEAEDWLKPEHKKSLFKSILTQFQQL